VTDLYSLNGFEGDSAAYAINDSRQVVRAVRGGLIQPSIMRFAMMNSVR
jgi:hypothetical protein